VAQLSERVCLDLAYTLSCYADPVSNLFQGVRTIAVQSETQSQHTILTRCEVDEHPLETLAQ
jgi:hypothetical protein